MSREFIITSRYLSIEGELLLRALLSIMHSKSKFLYLYNSDIDIHKSSIVIVNIDDEQGKNLWNKYIKEQTPIIVAYTEKSKDISGDGIFLTKPLRSVDLKQTLDKIAERLNNVSVKFSNFSEKENDDKYISANNKIKFENNDEKGIFENYLLGFVLKNRNNSLLIKNKKLIIIDAEKLRYYGILSELDMENLLLTNNYLLDIEEITPHKMVEYTHNMMSSELSTALWKVVLTHSKGKLLKNLNEGDIFKLKRWPNFKKLHHNPHHTKLTVYLSKYGADIKTLAKISKTPIKDVVNFINACYALHYLEISEHQRSVDSQHLTKSATMPSSKSTLFTKIRNRLGI